MQNIHSLGKLFSVFPSLDFLLSLDFLQMLASYNIFGSLQAAVPIVFPL